MRCIAVGCKTGRKSGLRIHSFPRDPKRRLEWAVKVNLAENGKLWVPPKESSCYGICEAHFEEDQYEPRRTDRKLKAFAVPTLFEHRRPPRRRRQLRRSTPPPAPVKEPEPKKDARLTAASIAASNDHTYLAPRDQPPSVGIETEKVVVFTLIYRNVPRDGPPITELQKGTKMVVGDRNAAIGCTSTLREGRHKDLNHKWCVYSQV
ncbi:mucin-5AC isoform X2 [Ixodes scapularis]